MINFKTVSISVLFCWNYSAIVAQTPVGVAPLEVQYLACIKNGGDTLKCREILCNGQAKLMQVRYKSLYKTCDIEQKENLQDEQDLFLQKLEQLKTMLTPEDLTTSFFLMVRLRILLKRSNLDYASKNYKIKYNGEFILGNETKDFHSLLEDGYVSMQITELEDSTKAEAKIIINQGKPSYQITEAVEILTRKDNLLTYAPIQAPDCKVIFRLFRQGIRVEKGSNCKLANHIKVTGFYKRTGDLYLSPKDYGVE